VNFPPETSCIRAAKTLPKSLTLKMAIARFTKISKPSEFYVVNPESQNHSLRSSGENLSTRNEIRLFPGMQHFS
jgi:hypothetical protein